MSLSHWGMSQAVVVETIPVMSITQFAGGTPPLPLRPALATAVYYQSKLSCYNIVSESWVRGGSEEDMIPLFLLALLPFLTPFSFFFRLFMHLIWSVVYLVIHLFSLLFSLIFIYLLLLLSLPFPSYNLTREYSRKSIAECMTLNTRDNTWSSCV